KVKTLLCSAPVLHHTEPDKPFFIEVDGSRHGLGAVLNQKDEKGKLYPISYASVGLNPAESRYSATELEALAVKFALTKFKSFIWGNEVFVLTDHKALTFLAKSQNPDSPSKYHRWALIVDASNAKLVYKKGAENTAADALSRSQRIQEGLPDQWDIDSIVYALPTKDDSVEVAAGAQRDAIRALQKADPELMAVIDSVEQASVSSPSSSEIKKNYVVLDGILYVGRSSGLKVVVPIGETQRLMKEHHSLPCGGHLSSGRVL
ncbi:MAG: hypothetical protein GY740_22080, partial [Gammaproteobacteria bacterium]|nr:hypothetical protein [Gammaproteobacteria bacterium]